MRFKITLLLTDKQNKLPLNYQYEFSAWVYKVLKNADEEFANFLHNEGYKTGKKTFKFFAFSNLKIPSFRIQEDRIIIQSSEISFYISFYTEQIAENFIIGLFQQQTFAIGDKISNVSFQVKSVESLQTPIFLDEMTFQTASPVVIGQKNTGNTTTYLSPIDENFATLLLDNLLEKFKATQQVIPAEWQNFSLHFELLNPSSVKSRLVTIKAKTKEETKVRGFYNFRFKLKAPTELMKLALFAGIGRENALGFGAIELFSSSEK